MKMRETSGATDKELSVNNKLFLNPERVSMPDIDTDFSDERRPEVIEYVRQKYGEDHVSRIITFGTLAAKMSVKDVGRTLGLPPATTQKIANAIPTVPGITLDKALKESPEFREMYDSEPDVKKIVDLARKIEGTARNMSQHACGVVIAKNPVSDNIPEVLLKDRDGNPAYTAAFEKEEVEENGCIKFDFLGLRNMSILQNASNAVGQDYRKLPFFDPEVYAFIGTGNTEGIFQIESPGMKDLVKSLFGSVKKELRSCKTRDDREKLGRECFERLVAAVALYRPGPLDYIPDYLDNMRNPNNIVYDTPELKPILSATYGTITYQEQVQQICRTLAGYSYGRADLIRRGMAKKKPKIIAKEKDIFLYGNKKDFESGKDNTYVPGCIENGISETAARVIWAKMEKFAEYAFNKSHAAAYAVISAQTAWLKYYYPVEFWVATLNSVIGKADKICKYLYYAQNNGIGVLPPDITKSQYNFSSENGKIRIGLSAIRNLGKSGEEIVQERETNGAFLNFNDFIKRCSPGKKVIVSIALSGAADSFGYKRKALSESHEAIGRYKKKIAKTDQLAFDLGLEDQSFAILEENCLSRDVEFPKQEKLQHEYEYIGMYVSEHPLDEHQALISSMKPDPIVDMNIDREEIDELPLNELNKKVKIVGILKEVEHKYTRSGEKMIVGKIEDKTGSIQFSVFAKTLEYSYFNSHLLKDNEIVILDGIRRVNDFGCNVIVNAVNTLAQYSSTLSRIYCLTDKEHYKSLVDTVRTCKEGNLVVVVQIDIEQGKSNLVTIDEENGSLYSRRDRDINDPRNLRVDFSEYFKIKEVCKNIKLA